MEADREATDASLAAFQDCGTQGEPFDESMRGAGYVPMPLSDSFSVDATFTDWDAHLATLSKKARRFQRKIIEPFDNAWEMAILDTNSPTPSKLMMAHFHGLYRAVQERNLAFNTFPLPVDFFDRMLTHPGFELLTLTLRPEAGGSANAMPQAYVACFAGDTQYVALVAGLDYRFVSTHAAYRQLLKNALLRAPRAGSPEGIFRNGSRPRKETTRRSAHKPSSLCSEPRSLPTGRPGNDLDNPPSSRRATGVRKLLRRVILVALVLAFTLGVAIYWSTDLRLNKHYEIPENQITVRSNEETRTRGQHLVRSVAQCTTCHGDDLAGDVMSDDWLLGRLDAPNLTPGRGGIAARSNLEIAETIRHGVNADRRPTLLMNSDTLRVLSDADVAAIIAYLRSIPAVDRESRPRWAGPLTRLVIFLDAVPEFIPAELIDHNDIRREVAPGPTAEYGEYLVQVGACGVCHGADLEGGLNPLALKDEPPPARLAPGGALTGWHQDDFLVAMRTGRTPDGRQLNERFMPWRVTARMKERRTRRHLAIPQIARDPSTGSCRRRQTLRDPCRGSGSGCELGTKPPINDGQGDLPCVKPRGRSSSACGGAVRAC